MFGAKGAVSIMISIERN